MRLLPPMIFQKPVIRLFHVGAHIGAFELHLTAANIVMLVRRIEHCRRETVPGPADDARRRRRGRRAAHRVGARNASIRSSPTLARWLLGTAPKRPCSIGG
jgi:hypothetical protein